MSTSLIVVLIVLVVLVAAVLLVKLWRQRSGFQVRPLSEESRRTYQADWSRLQENFVDAPAETVAEADRLVAGLLGEIGCPEGEFDERADALSKRHGKAAASYRRAHDVLTSRSTVDHEGEPPTDALRRALLDYRSVFQTVIGRERVNA
jgi:hypothetical protein